MKMGLIIYLVMVSSSIWAQDRLKGLTEEVTALLPVQSVRANGHPKLVALLVGEDYERQGSSPWPAHIRPLPGVRQDLARMHRRLSALGFGKIVVLGSDRQAGQTETVMLQAVPGISEESAGHVDLRYDGPATRAAMVSAANRLRQHLQDNRTADDGHGNQVRPLFVFYYSGHGFVNGQGVHGLPLSDNVAGEPTGDLVKLIANTVGADDSTRSAAGNGSTLVFLDCCQAGKGLQAANRSVATGGLLESGLMEAIRAGRKGRFLIGASLGDENARENASGGFFTSALCAGLVAERLGKDRPEEASLSLLHLVLNVDNTLRSMGKQAVSLFPPQGEVAWDNYVLFANPHFKAPKPTLQLYVTTSPATARVVGKVNNTFYALEDLSPSIMRISGPNAAGQSVYEVPAGWHGRTLTLKAEPASASDRALYEPSVPQAVTLSLAPSGAPPVLALALREVRGGQQTDWKSNRAQGLIDGAELMTDPLDRYRQFQAAKSLLTGEDGLVAQLLVKGIDQNLTQLRPHAGRQVLQGMIDSACVPIRQDQYRIAYDQLKQLSPDAVVLREFDLPADTVATRFAKAQKDVIEAWNDWADKRRKAEADKRLTEGQRFLNDGQPWHTWRRAFEAGVLVGNNPQVQAQMAQAQEMAMSGLFTGQVNLEVLVGSGAHGIVQSLVTGGEAVPIIRTLAQVLRERFDVNADDLPDLMIKDQKRFRERHPNLFPPGIDGSDFGKKYQDEMVLIPAGTFTMGSNDGGSDEKPVHEVYLDEFYMDKYEVTNAQYAEFVNAIGHREPQSVDWGSESWNRWLSSKPPAGMADHPVVGVNWEDAKAYCAWAGKRLPTEAEWEKACRGGVEGQKYPWGNNLSSSQANYDGSEIGKTREVGAYAPNSYGLYDMSGNVWEWVTDGYSINYYSHSPLRNPKNISEANHVIRGGAWSNYSYSLRCAVRDGAPPNKRDYSIGFRCAR